MNADSDPAALERIVLFSDAVFAIAITLLVLEIHVPPSSEHDVGYALRELWPQFFSFGMSFVVIGQFWVAHHRMFRLIAKYDSRFLWFNLALLLGVAFLPFATALLGQHSGNRVAVDFYSVALIVTGLASAALWQYAAFRRRLLRDDATDAVVRYVSQRSVVVPVVFFVALLVGLFSGRAAEVLWVVAFPTLALVRLLHRPAV